MKKYFPSSGRASIQSCRVLGPVIAEPHAQSNDSRNVVQTIQQGGGGVPAPAIPSALPWARRVQVLMHELTGPQRWLISVGAPLNKRNGRRLDRLGGDGRPTISWEASAVLRNGWQVRTSEDVVGTVSWLLGGSHRAEYEKAGLGTAREFAGWDAQRVANVAGWAYAAYLVDLETAWAWHRQAGALVRESFTSWADYGASYLAGLASWCEGEREVLDPSEQAMTWLLNDPSSPWLTLPFDLDLGDTPAPDLAPIEVLVGQANTPTIADAIQLAGPDGRVLVPAGTYREVIAPTHGIEIVAQGEVTVESAHVPCVRIEKMVGARLQGITLRSQLTADGKSLNAVHVNRGYVRMEACDVAASHDGVRVVTWGSAHVVDSTFHDCGSNGLNLVSGQLIVERCTVQRSAQNGIELQGEAGALVDECSIEDSGAASVLAHGKVRATLRRSTFTRNAGSASVVGIGSSDLLIDEVSIAGSQSGGIFFQETASAAISRTRITGCKLAALDVATTEPIQADEITATGNASAGVLVRNRAKLLLRGSQLEDSAEGHVWVLDTGILAMADCRLARGALGAVGARRRCGGGARIPLRAPHRHRRRRAAALERRALLRAHRTRGRRRRVGGGGREPADERIHREWRRWRGRARRHDRQRGARERDADRLRWRRSGRRRDAHGERAVHRGPSRRSGASIHTRRARSPHRVTSSACLGDREPLGRLRGRIASCH
ncbi:MAG: DUF1266 domain-containing protein [Sandaracinaceae bacterium]|nr:DUF1266 domain-containing protein [Sandaracinaceae bacterium]